MPGMGLALGGGIGLSMRQHGLTCDNILAAQIVIANGSLVSKSDNTVCWTLARICLHAHYQCTAATEQAMIACRQKGNFCWVFLILTVFLVLFVACL